MNRIFFSFLLAIAASQTFGLEIRVDFEENAVPATGNWNTVDSATGSDATDLIDWNTGLGTGISLAMTGLSTSTSTEWSP